MIMTTKVGMLYTKEYFLVNCNVNKGPFPVPPFTLTKFISLTDLSIAMATSFNTVGRGDNFAVPVIVVEGFAEALTFDAYDYALLWPTQSSYVTKYKDDIEFAITEMLEIEPPPASSNLF